MFFMFFIRKSMFLSSMQNGVGVIGPRDNVFPGPAVALDGPEYSMLITWSSFCFFIIFAVLLPRNAL